MDKDMKTILITGANGLVGSSCVALFKKKKWNVIGIDNNNRAKTLGTPVKEGALELDFTKANEVFELFEKNTFDAVIHAGAQPSHDWSRDHVIEDFMTNAFGTVLLLEATRRYSPHATFVYVSTDKTYGENMTVPLKELSTRLEPMSQSILEGFDEILGMDFAGKRSPFGVSKVCADFYVQEYAAQGWLTTGIFRPGCITGRNHEGAELHGFLAYLAKCIKEGLIYNVYGFKGKQVRDQIHADDVATAFYEFIQKPRNGEVYNIGGGPNRAVSVLEAGQLISQAVSKPFVYEEYEERPGDRPWDVHNMKKFTSHYPKWHMEYDLSAIIKDVISK